MSLIHGVENGLIKPVGLLKIGWFNTILESINMKRNGLKAVYQKLKVLYQFFKMRIEGLLNISWVNSFSCGVYWVALGDMDFSLSK